MREKLAKYPWYHDALPKEWETMKIVLSWGVCFRMYHLLYSQMSKVKKHPKLQGPSCVCSWLHALVVASMGSVRDVRELVEGLVLHCLTLIPLQTAKQESEKPENRANVQTTVLGEKKMQLKKIKMNLLGVAKYSLCRFFRSRKFYSQMWGFFNSLAANFLFFFKELPQQCRERLLILK